MCKFVYSFLIGLMVLTIHVPAASQVIISEFMAQNSTSISDDFGDKSDWIEIYNSGTNAIDLVGWHLTDTTNDLRSGHFPRRTSRPIVTCSCSRQIEIAETLVRRCTQTSVSRPRANTLRSFEPDGTNIASEFRLTFPLQLRTFVWIRHGRA